MPPLLLTAAAVLGVVLTGCAQEAGTADHDTLAVEADAGGPEHDASASEGRKGTTEALDTDANNISPAGNVNRLVEFFLEVLWEMLVLLYQQYLFEIYVTLLQESGWFSDSPFMQICLVVVPFALSFVVVEYFCKRRKKLNVVSGPQPQPSRSASADSAPSVSASATGAVTEGSTGPHENSIRSPTGGAARREASGAATPTNSANQPRSRTVKWADEVEYVGAVIATGLEKCDVTCDVNNCDISPLNRASFDDEDALRRPNSSAWVAQPLSPAVRGSVCRGLRCSAAPLVTSSHRLAQMSFRLDKPAD